MFNRGDMGGPMGGGGGGMGGGHMGGMGGGGMGMGGGMGGGKKKVLSHFRRENVQSIRQELFQLFQFRFSITYCIVFLPNLCMNRSEHGQWQHGRRWWQLWRCQPTNFAATGIDGPVTNQVFVANVSINRLLTYWFTPWSTMTI